MERGTKTGAFKSRGRRFRDVVECDGVDRHETTLELDVETAEKDLRVSRNFSPEESRPRVRLLCSFCLAAADRES